MRVSVLHGVVRNLSKCRCVSLPDRFPKFVVKNGHSEARHSDARFEDDGALLQGEVVPPHAAATLSCVTLRCADVHAVCGHWLSDRGESCRPSKVCEVRAVRKVTQMRERAVREQAPASGRHTWFSKLRRPVDQDCAHETRGNKQQRRPPRAREHALASC